MVDCDSYTWPAHPTAIIQSRLLRCEPLNKRARNKHDHFYKYNMAHLQRKHTEQSRSRRRREVGLDISIYGWVSFRAPPAAGPFVNVGVWCIQLITLCSILFANMVIAAQHHRQTAVQRFAVLAKCTRGVVLLHRTVTYEVGLVETSIQRESCDADNARCPSVINSIAFNCFSHPCVDLVHAMLFYWKTHNDAQSASDSKRLYCML